MGSLVRVCVALTLMFYAPNAWADADVSFVDDFERAELGADWVVPIGGFSIRDGVLAGREIPKNHHGSVARVKVPFQNGRIQFRFRLVGSKQFNLVIDDKNCKEVHAGHIARVVVNQKLLRLTDDREGPMRNDIFARRKAGASKEELAALTDGRSVTAKQTIAADEWHTLVVEFRGDVMTATIDDGATHRLQSPGIAHPTKTQFGFTVIGAGAEFDDVRFESLE